MAYVKTLPTYAAGFAKDGRRSLFNWVEAEPRNVGGRSRALAVDVADPNTILVGSVSGGMWKSTDEGGVGV